MHHEQVAPQSSELRIGLYEASDDFFDYPTFTSGMINPVGKLGRASLDLLDDAASKRMKRHDAAFQRAFLDLKLSCNPGPEFIRRALVEGHK